MRGDAVVGMVCLAGSAALYSTLGLIDDPRAIAFPRTIIIIMGILSALLVVQGLLVPGEKKKETTPYPWIRFLVLFAMIVAYLALSETLGFYLSAFLFFVTVAFGLGRASLSPRKAALRLAGSAVFTGVLYLLFQVVLEVQTPRGLWF